MNAPLTAEGAIDLMAKYAESDVRIRGAAHKELYEIASRLYEHLNFSLSEIARLQQQVDDLETGLGLNEDEDEPQTVARGLSAKEAALRLMADTSPVPANANLFALAADKERGAVIAAAQAEAGGTA